LLLVSKSAHSDTQRYSDSQLIQIGQDVYNKGDYVAASMFLFAYIQKNPQALSTNSQFTAEVQKAYQFSLDEVRKAWNTHQTAPSQASNQQGVGKVTQGLGTAPPPLRIPDNAR
jgi:hypothetical protein